MTKTAKTLTGAVLAVVVGVAAAGAALASHGRFSDLPPYHRHVAEIAEAHHLGLFEGYPDGTFRPDQTLTNSQAETVLRRMLDRYRDDNGDSTLTRAQAAVLLARGVCRLDGDCIRDIPPVHAAPGGRPAPERIGYWRFEGREGWNGYYLRGWLVGQRGTRMGEVHLRVGCGGGGEGQPPAAGFVVIGHLGGNLSPADVRITLADGSVRPARWPGHGAGAGTSAPDDVYSFLTTLMATPGPMEVEWSYTANGHFQQSPAIEWPDTSGLATVAAYLDGVCGILTPGR